MKTEELRERIGVTLGEQWVLTLSFADREGPWSAPVYYAEDGLDLYFVSDPNSRHGRYLAANPRIAACVDNRGANWREIKGLQMAGEAVLLEDKHLQRHAEGAYMRKFPFTRVFFLQKQLLDPLLADKVKSASFYLFKPDRIKLVDNRVAFGFQQELVMRQQVADRNQS